jgi:hypothetical protein
MILRASRLHVQLSQLLLALYGLHMLAPALPFAEYALNYQTIRTQLCVRQTEGCNGLCYLKKQIAVAYSVSGATETPPGLNGRDNSTSNQGPVSAGLPQLDLDKITSHHLVHLIYCSLGSFGSYSAYFRNELSFLKWLLVYDRTQPPEKL